MSLLREVPIQAGHRLLPKDLWVSDDEITRELRRERARALRRIGSTSYFAGAPLRSLTVVLWAINEAEAAGGDAEAARGYAAIGAALSSLRLSGVARRYTALARATAETGSDEAVRGFCSWAEAASLMWRGRWAEARAAATKAEGIAVRLGDRNTLEQCRLVLMSICHWTGDLEGTVLRADEITRSAEERGDLRHLGVSLIAAIISLARLGRLDEAEARLARISAGAVLPEAELGLLGCRALLLCYRGDLEAAVMPAEQAASKVSLMMPLVVPYSVYTAAIEVHLARWEAAHGARSAIAVEAERAAARALRSFFRCSLRFELCAPFYHELRGRQARIAGARRRARASQERAIELARRLRMLFPEARAHLELARLSPPRGAARAAHLDAAEALFQQIGCQPDLEVCRALRERPPSD